MDTGLVRKRSIDKSNEGQDPRDMTWVNSDMKRVATGPRIHSTCSMASFLIGIALIAAGFFLMWWVDLDKLQQEQEAVVKEEIGAWNRLHKDAWEATQWDLLVNGTEIGKLIPSLKTSVLEDSSGLSVTSAQRTRMNVVGTVFPFPKNLTTKSGATGRTVTEFMQSPVVIEAQATRLGVEQQRVVIHEGPLVWSSAKITNSWKACHYADRGYWNPSTRLCTSWHFLLHLCVNLEMDFSSNHWSIGNRYEGSGCNIFQQFDPMGVRRLPVSNYRLDTPPLITVEQGYESKVTIMNAHDPYLFAANLTRGSMVLAEDKINEIALGVTSAVFGFVLMIPFILLNIIFLLEKRSKPADDHSFDDIPFYACEVDNREVDSQ